MTLDTDVLVIGSGIAGLTFALKVAPSASVLLITKKEKAEAATNYARGGIAAVLGEDDDPELHIADSLEAGAGLCHQEVVERLVREGPGRVRELMDWGARFHREKGRLSLGREGGHSRRRILHAGDQTGQEIERALLEAVEAEPRIRVLEDHLAVDLRLVDDATGRRSCRGASALDHRRGQAVEVVARACMLASGGCGQVYRHTTNPSIATGDGVAMAYRAGARVANMEFIQFHPTALFPTEDPAFLISEALRGEGALLRLMDGTPFMDRYHPLASLAPRDVVARAIDHELRQRGEPHALLDVSPISKAALEKRFPDTVRGCQGRGVDLYRDGIPVVPAAHYVCGGVLTDSEGRTSLPGLFAAGEVACTGVHGANRLASNSLLEAVVFSHRSAGAVLEAMGDGQSLSDSLVESPVPAAEAAAGSPELPAEGAVGADELRNELRALMWELVGIVRSDALLEEAEHRVTTRLAATERAWKEQPWTPEGVEVRNLLQVAELIVCCARLRHESRGLHHNVDHPWRDNERFLCDTVVRR